MSFFNNYFDLPTNYDLLFNKTESCKQNTVSRESVIRDQMSLINNRLIVTEMDDDMIQRVAESAYQKMFESDRGQELLFKAEKYNIPYKMSRIDWLKLIDDIHRYERLIDEAEELGIDGGTCLYDPVYLEQEIERVKRQNLNSNRDEIASFFASRGVEV